ncbi:MAG: GNAT family N-acetyltransferase [Paludibacter sp.]|nr:GNAT family N-acetyltransferase [Paludibacter sp.]
MIELNKIQISKAQNSDTDVLTDISFAAKKHWNYPDSYYDLWRDELTITKEYILQNIVFKALYMDVVIGFYSITENKEDFYSGGTFVKKGFWLEHLFIKPEYHKLGIGALLINHAKQVSRDLGITDLLIFVDPYAKGFYDKVGARYLYDSKSSIPGRMIPVYGLRI